MFIKVRNFSKTELDHFRKLQRRSFAILEDMAATLEEGQTEKEVARSLVRRYREAGVSSFFHLPVVLFGERTALPGAWPVRKFFPKSRKLQPGDSVVLDAAPIFKGYLVDTSYSCCFGENQMHRKVMKDLAKFRDGVLHSINEGVSFKTVADNVRTEIQALGYEPVHCKHPGDAFGHRAVKMANLPFAWRVQGFDAMSLGWFVLKGKAASLGLAREAPIWNSDTTSDHPPHDGLWLVEPHAGDGLIGAKWEEILVIQNGRAEWLDDEPPHVRQWAQIAKGDDYRPQRQTRH